MKERITLTCQLLMVAAVLRLVETFGRKVRSKTLKNSLGEFYLDVENITLSR